MDLNKGDCSGAANQFRIGTRCVNWALCRQRRPVRRASLPKRIFPQPSSGNGSPRNRQPLNDSGTLAYRAREHDRVNADVGAYLRRGYPMSFVGFVQAARQTPSRPRRANLAIATIMADRAITRIKAVLRPVRRQLSKSVDELEGLPQIMISTCSTYSKRESLKS